jgi:hypothetical protein
VWNAPTTTDRDRKELLRTLIEEVILNLKRAEGRAHLTLRWRGGVITVLDVPVTKMKSKAAVPGLFAFAVSLVGLLCAGSAGASTEKVLYSFQGVLQHGQHPMSPLISDASGNLYGTTNFGGDYFRHHSELSDFSHTSRTTNRFRRARSSELRPKTLSTGGPSLKGPARYVHAAGCSALPTGPCRASVPTSRAL